MKKTTWRRFFTLGAIGVCLTALACFGGSAQFASAQDEPPCPFLDDEIILFWSPSNLANAGSVKTVWDCEEGQKVLDAALAKAQADLAKKLENKDENFPTEKFEYVESVLKENLGDLSLKAVLNAYFHRVDGVVLALDAPENYKDAPQGLSLTYLVNFNLGIFDPRKLFKEGEEMTVLKDENGVFVASVSAKKDGKEAFKVYFGGVKIKDMEEYALVFAATQENVEKKLTRFQNTNAFIAKRLTGAEKPCAEYIFKEGFFQGVVAAIDEKAKDDKKAQDFKDLCAKLRSVRFKVLGSDVGIAFTLDVEAIDADTAKNFRDLAVGGVAMASLSAEKKELKPEEKFGLEVLKSIEFTNDDAFARARFDVDVDAMKEATKVLIWDKVSAELAK